MEILAKETDWLPTDSVQLAAFLSTETGKRLIPELTKAMPPLLEGGGTNEILIRNGQVLAFNKIVESLILLAHPQTPSPEPQSDYPALENDAAWNDGQKLEVKAPA